MMGIKHALIVDDSRSARVALRKLLEKRGISVDLAESGEEALNMLKSTAPDVVFMDHMMPGMDGFTTTQNIRANPSLSAIPVVMCTSKEGDSYIQEAKAIGASAILIKPAPPSKLDELIKFLESAPSLPGAPAPAPGTNTPQNDAVAQAMMASKTIAQQSITPDFERTRPQPPQQPIQPIQVAGVTPEEVDTKIRAAFDKSLDFTKIQAIVNKFTNQHLQEEKNAMLTEVKSSIASFKSEFEKKNKQALNDLDRTVPLIVDQRMQASFSTQLDMAIEARLNGLQQHVADHVRLQLREDLERTMIESLDSHIRGIMRHEFDEYEKQIAEQFSEFEKYIDNRYTPESMIELLEETIHKISAEISIEIAEKESLRIAEEATHDIIDSFKNTRKAEMKDAMDERFLMKTQDFKFLIQKYSALAAALGLTGALVFSVLLKVVL